MNHLVEHRGGWNQRVAGFDPCFRMRDIARALGLRVAPTKQDIVRFMAGEEAKPWWAYTAERKRVMASRLAEG